MSFYSFSHSVTSILGALLISFFKKEKMLNDKSIVVWIGITILGCVVLSVLLPLAPDEWIYPDEVLNTFEACDWCESNCSNYYEHCPYCVGGGTCCACMDYYQTHFNLTQEIFQCYCWDSDESAPNKIEWFFMEHF